jgi:high-affinity iron transporter
MNIRVLLAAAGACAALLLAIALQPGGGAAPSVRLSGGVEDPGIAPAANAGRKPIVKITNSKLSGQEAADAAAGKPTAAGPRSEVQPLAASAFRAPVAAYRRYAIHDARRMAVPVAALRRAVARGDRGAARSAWKAAYTDYLLLGAAYGALGDLDVAIDGGAGGLPRGVEDPHFTGLHRVEHGLWTGTPLRTLRGPSARLAADVAKLPRKLSSMAISPLDYATRAHEILEDAQRDMLSGQAAPWSGAGLMATDAARRATHVVIGTLATTLAGRGEVLGPVRNTMLGLDRAFARVRRDHGGTLPALGALTHDEHALITGRLGTALEALSGIPGDLETQPAPVVPSLPTRGHTK